MNSFLRELQSLKVILTSLLIVISNNLFAAPSFTLVELEQIGSPPTQLKIGVIAKDFKNIVAFQGSVAWPQATFLLSGTSNFSRNIPGFNEGFISSKEEAITFAWFDNQLKGISLADDEILFELLFDIPDSSKTDPYIELTNQPIPLELLDASFNTMSLEAYKLDITFNKFLIIANDDSWAVTMNSSNNILDILGNDILGKSTSVSISNLSVPIEGGSATLTADGKKVIYQPKPGYSGLDSFSYVISDGHANSTGNVNVTVQDSIPRLTTNWIIPQSPMTYGDAFDTQFFNGSASVPGEWNYTFSNIRYPVGVVTIKAIFTPENLNYYAVQELTRAVQIIPRNIIISANDIVLPLGVPLGNPTYQINGLADGYSINDATLGPIQFRIDEVDWKTKGEGSFKIIPFADSTSNYNIEFQAGELRVTPAVEAEIHFSDESLNQDIDNFKPVRVETNPEGLAYEILYNGQASLPTEPNGIEVSAKIVEPGYKGSTTARLILKKRAVIEVLNSSTTYNGSQQMPEVRTIPPGLNFDVELKSENIESIDAGKYEFLIQVKDPIYYGDLRTSFVIKKANAIVKVDPKTTEWIENGPKNALGITTNPKGLGVITMFGESNQLPTKPGKHAYRIDVDHPNYQGFVEGFVNVLEAPPEFEQVRISFPKNIFDYSHKPLDLPVITEPEGISYEIRYNGQINPPVKVGSYEVSVVVTEDNFVGEATTIVTIVRRKMEFEFDPNSLFVPADNIQPPTFVGLPRNIKATVTYNGETDIPTKLGEYLVKANVDDPNYSGSCEGIYVIEGLIPILSLNLPNLQIDGSMVAVLLNGTCSSGAPVTYSIDSPHIATFQDESLLWVYGVGELDIKLSVNQSGIWSAAEANYVVNVTGNPAPFSREPKINKISRKENLAVLTIEGLSQIQRGVELLTCDVPGGQYKSAKQIKLGTDGRGLFVHRIENHCGFFRVRYVE